MTTVQVQIDFRHRPGRSFPLQTTAARLRSTGAATLCRSAHRSCAGMPGDLDTIMVGHHRLPSPLFPCSALQRRRGPTPRAAPWQVRPKKAKAKVILTRDGASRISKMYQAPQQTGGALLRPHDGSAPEPTRPAHSSHVSASMPRQIATRIVHVSSCRPTNRPPMAQEAASHVAPCPQALHHPVTTFITVPIGEPHGR